MAFFFSYAYIHISDVVQLADSKRPRVKNAFVCVPTYLEKHTIDQCKKYNYVL